jgi:hypothetical protein
VTGWLGCRLAIVLLCYCSAWRSSWYKSFVHLVPSLNFPPSQSPTIHTATTYGGQQLQPRPLSHDHVSINHLPRSTNHASITYHAQQLVPQPLTHQLSATILTSTPYTTTNLQRHPKTTHHVQGYVSRCTSRRPSRQHECGCHERLFRHPLLQPHQYLRRRCDRGC